MNQYLKDFGAFICTAREQAGFTQHALGEKLGFKSGQFISNLERGLCSLPPKHIPRLSNVLRLNQDEVINELLKAHGAKLKLGGSL